VRLSARSGATTPEPSRPEPWRCHLVRVALGHHRETPRRRPVHLSVDARAGEAPHGGAATAAAAAAAARRSPPVAAHSRACVGRRRRREIGKGEMELGLARVTGDGVFVSPKRADSRRSRPNGRDRPARVWARFGPGGREKWWPGPRLAQPRAARARGAVRRGARAGP
jgi:hypothetical protein